MSQTIQEIERRVGCRLFERTSRRVTLTLEGRMLIDRIRPPYDELRCSYRQAVADVRSVERIIRIGFTVDASEYASRLIRALRGQVPEYGVSLREMAGGDPYGPLRRGEVDAVLGTVVGAHPDLLVGPVLGSEPVVLASSHDHALAGWTSISTADFAGERILEIPGPEPDPGQAQGGAFVRAEVTYPGVDIAYPLVRTWHELLALVAAGQGVALLTSSLARYYAGSEVRFAPVVDLAPRPVALIWRRVDHSKPVRKLLTNALGAALPAPRRIESPA